MSEEIADLIRKKQELFADYIRQAWPDKSPAWRIAYAERLKWYLGHDGDMTDAPPLPEST